MPPAVPPMGEGLRWICVRKPIMCFRRFRLAEGVAAWASALLSLAMEPKEHAEQGDSGRAEGLARVSRPRPTRLFISYSVQLAFRLVLLCVAVCLFAFDPHAVDVSATFGLQGGFNFVDFAFIALILDFLTKFFVRAPISSGSLKQYRIYHIPTAATFRGGTDALRARFRDIAELGRRLTENGKTAIAETREGLAVRGNSIAAFVRRLLNDIDFLHVLSFDEKDLAVDKSARAVLYRDRTREIVPVIVFWAALNAALAAVLHHLGVLDERVALLWSLFYFLFDMVCVVFWCPLQLFLMRNRCCTTCQIFNWDAIMVATPLAFMGGWFGGILIAVALVILVRWELAAIRHPERFDERTNARLSCAQCVDKLCYLRKPLAAKIPRADLRELLEADEPKRG